MWRELIGAFQYEAVSSGGTITVPIGAAVTQIVAIGGTGSTVTIFGGASITLPSMVPMEFNFNHTLLTSVAGAQTIVFANTSSAVVFWAKAGY